MRTIRWAAVAVVGAVTLSAVGAAASANAATSTTSGSGRAQSSLTLLRLTAAGHTVKTLAATLTTTTLGNPSKAAIDLVPVKADGTNLGAQHIDQDTSGQPSIGPRTGSIAGAVSLTSPSVVLRAARTAEGPLASVIGSGIGSASLLGIRLPSLSGSLTVGSHVQSGTAKAVKAITVRGLSLPSITALLAKLGLDVSALPVDVLRQLVNKLSLATGAFDTAAAALDSALSTAGSTIDGIDLSTVDAAANAVSDQQGVVSTKRTAVNDALAAAPFGNPALVTLLGTLGISAPTSAAQWDALSGSAQSQLVTALNTVTSGSGTAIATADSALATARALLTTLTDITGLLNDLLDVILGILGNTPLLSVGSLRVGTLASAGGAHAAKITGSLSGLHVLGTDVLQQALGTHSLDLVGLASSTLDSVQTTVNGLTRTLSTTLSKIAGLTVPLPRIEVLARHTSTAPVGAFQAATAAVTGLRVTWPGLTLPKSLAVPGALALPAVGASPSDATDLVTSPIRVSVANLEDTAEFAAASSTPGVTTPGGTPTPGSSTPTTGLPAGLAVVALALVLMGLVARRTAIRRAAPR